MMTRRDKIIIGCYSIGIFGAVIVIFLVLI